MHSVGSEHFNIIYGNMNMANSSNKYQDTLECALRKM